MRCRSVGCSTTNQITQSDYAMHYSRSHYAVIRVYDAAGNVIKTRQHVGDFVEP